MPRKNRIEVGIDMFQMDKANGGLRYSRFTDDTIDESKRERKISKALENWQHATTPINVISKWQDYVSCRRKLLHDKAEKKNKAVYREGPAPRDENTRRRKTTFDNLNSTHQGIDSDVSDGEEKTRDRFSGSFGETQESKQSFKKIATANNRALIIYFSKLASSSSTSDEIDLDFVEGLIKNGADINVTDKHGQTVFHEVARLWHLDVAKFLKENGADVNKPDKFGRTPLHVASAVNYPEMVEYLVQIGAKTDAKTFGEDQTPIHYAAKNDAVNSLKVLVKLGSNLNCRDFKKRTPLQLAAELDRSETAKYLVEQGVPVGVCDSSDLPALTIMIQKMPLVAKEALGQFHATDRANRKQYFYLNYLETKLPGQESSFAKLPMECSVEFKHLDMIMHPVFRKLIEIKWKKFGKTRCLFRVAINLIFVLIWTTVGLTLPRDYKYYTPISTKWWHIILESIAVLWTLWFIFLELWEYRSSSLANKRWKRWRRIEIEKDLQFCHPRWPEERKYLMQEIDEVEQSKISYFKDAWNYLDWMTYGWIMSVIISRVIAVLSPNSKAKSLHARFMAVALIFIWLRLMKVLRTFQALGPFIVMIGHIVDDTLKFLFVYFLLFIPYVCAFWIIFGGSINAAIMKKAGQPVDSWQKFNDLIFTVSQITVVGDFDFNSLTAVDRLTAQLLVGTFIALSGIVMINLFIALMSDTFQRVYDNAKANAVMQQASAILDVEQSLSKRKRDSFRMLIHRKCSPLEDYYDDDDTGESGELEKMTFQIKEVVDDIDENIKTQFQDGGMKKSVDAEFQAMKDYTSETMKKQERTIRQMDRKIDELTKLVNELLNRTAPDPNRLANLPPPSALSTSFSMRRALEPVAGSDHVRDERQPVVEEQEPVRVVSKRKKQKKLKSALFKGIAGDDS